MWVVVGTFCEQHDESYPKGASFQQEMDWLEEHKDCNIVERRKWVEPEPPVVVIRKEDD